MGWGLFVGTLMPLAGSDGCTLRMGAPQEWGGRELDCESDDRVC